MPDRGSPYRLFARIYDDVMRDVPYDAWDEYVQQLLAHHGHLAQAVADLACGTGSFTLRLARRGYRVVGVDRSAAMLAQARRKLAAAGLAADFVRADLARFQLARPVDLAVCVFDSWNYLLSEDQRVAAARQVARSLTPDGLFVFDVNTPHRLAQVRTQATVFEGGGYYLVWRDRYDSRTTCWEVVLDGFLASGRRSGGWRRFQEVHRERGLDEEQVTAELAAAGLEVQAAYSAYTLLPLQRHSARGFYVARLARP